MSPGIDEKLIFIKEWAELNDNKVDFDLDFVDSVEKSYRKDGTISDIQESVLDGIISNINFV